MRYYMVGTTPVRVRLRSVQGKTLPVAAEVRDKSTGAFKIDNSYLTDIDKGEEVKEITEDEFTAIIEAAIRRRSGSPP